MHSIRQLGPCLMSWWGGCGVGLGHLLKGRQEKGSVGGGAAKRQKERGIFL